MGQAHFDVSLIMLHDLLRLPDEAEIVGVEMRKMDRQVMRVHFEHSDFADGEQVQPQFRAYVAKVVEFENWGV